MASTKFIVGQRIFVTSAVVPSAATKHPNGTGALATVVADTRQILTRRSDVPLQFDGVVYHSQNDYHFRSESECADAGIISVTSSTSTVFKIGDHVRATYSYKLSHTGIIVKDYGNKTWGVRFDTYNSYMSPDDYHTVEEKILSHYSDSNVRCDTNVKASQKQTNEIDISDWRAWQHKAVGDCPCGIARQACSYHR